MKLAMITIEVLISMLILFMVIATSVSSLKQLRYINKKQQRYENIYIALFNIKNYIEDEICNNKYTIQGSFDKYNFSAKCTKEKILKNFEKEFENEGVEGNIGNYLVVLHKVVLTLKKQNINKSYLYYKTTVKRLK